MSGVYIVASIALFIGTVISYTTRTFKSTTDEVAFFIGCAWQLALMIIAAILL